MRVKDPTGNLDQVGAALHAGDRDAVMSCFAADATLGVISGEDQTTFSGSGIRDAVDALLTGFDGLKLTPVSRVVSDAGVLEESVVSGNHAGQFAGAEPTSRRVFVNVSLTATWDTDSTLKSLWVEADTRALFAQIAGTDDHVGVTSGLSAIARERRGGALRITDETIPLLAPTPSSDGRRRLGARSGWVVAMAAALVLLAAAAVRLGTSGSGTPAQAALSSPTTPTATRSTKAPTPAPSKTATPPARTARPVIATAAPRATPRVQRGKQVVLKSDVLFAIGSSALTPAATAALTRIAKQIRGNKVAGTIQINGYTDNRGGVAYDIALSRARALAVARVLQGALVGQRVALVPQGFGQANPIATNTTDVGRARNRRVTIVLPLVR